MVYTDGTHLIADTLEELHEFANLIGVKRCWFEGVDKGHPHYDIFGRIVDRAVEHGAIMKTSKQLIEIINGVRP